MLGDPMETKPIFVICCLTIFIFIMTSNYLLADVATLKRIAEAERDVTYVGLRLITLSTSSGSRTMEELVIHRTAEDSYRRVVSIIGGHKSLSPENDRERQRNDNNRNRNERRRGREFRWVPHRSQFSTKEIELIAQNYELELRHWGEKIAGHETDLLIIKPKHTGRSTKHIYFSRDKGVILRVEDLDAAGILRNMFVYNRISFESKAVKTKWDSVKKEIKPEPWHNWPSITLAGAEKILKKKPIQPTFLPTGFQLEGLYKLKIRGSEPIRLKYTDGLLDFSIYENADDIQSETTNRPPNRGDRNRERPVIKIGEISVRKHQRVPDNGFSWSSEGIHFFISGPIPPSELQKVVESIILKTDQK
ncbi:hypothetical protein F4212_01935 [Candidatus Poribacteria bacterium]|nr:hypothetical protein [Candidatus Poribacteria bacterium]